jgi:hypothetical protein
MLTSENAAQRRAKPPKLCAEFARAVRPHMRSLKNGNRSDYWVRWAACFRTIDGNWLIAHDHVSVPLDVASDGALLSLKP